MEQYGHMRPFIIQMMIHNHAMKRSCLNERKNKETKGANFAKHSDYNTTTSRNGYSHKRIRSADLTSADLTPEHIFLKLCFLSQISTQKICTEKDDRAIVHNSPCRNLFQNIKIIEYVK